MKKIYIAVVLLFAFCFSASAQLSFTSERKGDFLNVSGVSASGYPYDEVTVTVVAPKGSTGNITDAETLKNNLYWYEQITAGEDGSFAFSIDMKDAAPGRYKIKVSSGKETENGEILVFTEDDITGIADGINGAKTISELKNVIDISSDETDTALILSPIDELVFEADEDKTLGVLIALSAKSPVENGVENIRKRLTLAALIASLNEGKSLDISKYSELISADSDYMKTYNEKLSDKVKESFTADFAGSEISDELTLNSVLNEKIVLAVINNLRNRSDIEYVIKNHGADFGINVKAFESFAMASSLVNRLGDKIPYASMTDFTSEYKRLYSLLSENKSGGGSGGSSGGGASFGGKVDSGAVNTEVFAEGTGLPFEDMDEALWAKEYIVKLYDKGIINGVSERSFAPSKEIKREEFVKMLVGALNLKNDGAAVFSDVDENEWYYTWISYAGDIVNGYPDGTFGIGKNITREELMTVSYRAALKNGKKFSSEADSFADDDKISSFARDAVYALKAAGIIEGRGENLIEPEKPVTRAEAAKIICLISEYGGE